MNNKKNIIVLLIIFLLILFAIFVSLLFNNKENSKKDIPIYENKIFEYGGSSDGANRETFVFMENGTYLNFTTQFDETCDIRAIIGTWEEMYGEIYTTLVDDSIEAIDDNIEENSITEEE